jgi:threonine/homoserine/homoserine lactone efflux protein
MDALTLDIFGSALPLAVGIALSPFPIIAIVLLLMSPRGAASGGTFLIARVLGLSLVLGIVVIASDAIYALTSNLGLPAVVKLVIGLAVLVLGVTKWRPRGEGNEPALPKWMAAIDKFTPRQSFGLGFVLSVANPKELAFLLAAGVSIGGSGLSPRRELLIGGLFVAIGCISVLIPVIATLVAPKRMRPVLDATHVWLVKNNSTVMGVLLVVIGAVVVGGAIGSL